MQYMAASQACHVRRFFFVFCTAMLRFETSAGMRIQKQQPNNCLSASCMEPASHCHSDRSKLTELCWGVSFAEYAQSGQQEGSEYEEGSQYEEGGSMQGV